MRDAGQGHGEAQALADDVGGGVGVEVGGAALGLAAVDLVGVVQGLAVVGDEGQVDGQRLAAAAQGLGQVALQGAVEAALQFGEGGQGGQQGIVGGGVGGGVAQGGAGGGQRGDAAGGVEQDGPEHAGAALGAVVLEAQVFLAGWTGVRAWTVPGVMVEWGCAWLPPGMNLVAQVILRRGLAFVIPTSLPSSG